MDKKEIYSKVAGLIYDLLEVDIDEDEPDLTLEDMGADALDMIELSYDLEETFDIEMSDKDLDWLFYGDMTVKDLVEYVAKKMEG